MYETAFDIVALGMRYFFLVLILYILIRLVQHSLKEYKIMQEIKQQARSASPGYLEALSPESYAGKKLVLQWENTIGSSKRCNICVELPDISPLHAGIYEKNNGLYLADYGGKEGVRINGERVGKREELLYTQDVLQFGELICKLHLTGEEETDA